jgi:hypothetical protein
MPEQTLAGMVTGILPPAPLNPNVMLPSGVGAQADLVRMTIGREERTLRLPADAAPFHRWAVNTMHELERPLYVAVSDDVIVDAKIPEVGRIDHWEEVPDGTVVIGLDSSPRRFVLPGAGSERVRAICAASRDFGGIVMVTAEDDGSILDSDLAPFEAWHLAPVFGAEGAEDVEAILVTILGDRDVRRAFDLVAARDCRRAAPDDCIPFDYPDDGCFARAHKMFTTLRDAQIVAGKIWLGKMHTRTRNSKLFCDIHFTKHVAVYVRVPGNGTDSVLVLEPAFFDRGPVRFDDFVEGLHTSADAIRFSRGEFYQMGDTGGSRERRNQCEKDLAFYRGLAALRQPPPPYECA